MRICRLIYCFLTNIESSKYQETINAAYELNLTEGCRFERRIFHSMFSLDDQKEGMGAFAEKRTPNWTHK